jgi:cytochrome c5
MEINRQILQEKWAPVLDSQDAGKITDPHRRAVTAVVLENQEKAFAEERGLNEAAAANAMGAGAVAGAAAGAGPNIISKTCDSCNVSVRPSWCSTNDWSNRPNLCNESTIYCCW